jgi:hypothetical protein
MIVICRYSVSQQEPGNMNEGFRELVDDDDEDWIFRFYEWGSLVNFYRRTCRSPRVRESKELASGEMK